MKVVFQLKGGYNIEWRVPPMDPPFNFFMLIKLIRADGYFLNEGIYLQASEIAAALMQTMTPEEEAAADNPKTPNVKLTSRPKVSRLVS